MVAERVYQQAVEGGGRGRAWSGAARGMLLGGDMEGARAVMLKAVMDDETSADAW